MDQIPVKPPEEVLVLNEAEVELDNPKTVKGSKKGEEAKLAEGTDISLKLHQKHRKLESFFIENLDEDQFKIYKE